MIPVPSGEGWDQALAEAGCWAHVRRKFLDVHAAIASPIAKEALADASSTI